MSVKVTGIDRVNKELNRKLKEIGEPMTERFITSFLIQVQAKSSAMTPVDTSTLINSMYRKVNKSVKGWTGEFGYGAEYAKWVHEMPGTLKGKPREDFGTTKDGVSFGGGTGVGNYWDPNGEPQFLKKAMEDALENDLPALIAREFKI